MHILDILTILNPSLDPEKAKLHIATHSDTLGMQAIDIYLAGEFDEWQCWNEPGSFNRDLVISLISLPPRESNKWLFAGIYKCDGGQTEFRSKINLDQYKHNLKAEHEYHDIAGRLVVTFKRPGRKAYLRAEKWVQDILVSEMYPRRYSIGEFPGFKAINLSHSQLKLVVNESLESWRIALSHVAGIYLISDTKTGKLYVGSASGEQGIWGRWSDYVANGHGGNIELHELLKQNSSDFVHNFRYSILEISDVLTNHEDILQRERHWKDILLTRSYGLNAN